MDSFNFDRTGDHFATPECPVRPGENTLLEQIGWSGSDPVVLGSRGGVRVLREGGAWQRVPDPSQFDLLGWLQDVHRRRAAEAHEREVSAAADAVLRRVRRELLVQLREGVHGAPQARFAVEQGAVRRLVAEGSLRVLRDRSRELVVALAETTPGFVPARAGSVLWLAGTSAGSGVAPLLGWRGEVPLVFDVRRVQVFAVEGGCWTRPTAASPQAWIRDRLAEQREAVRRAELAEVGRAVRERLNREIAVTPRDDREQLVLDGLEVAAQVVRVGSAYVRAYRRPE